MHEHKGQNSTPKESAEKPPGRSKDLDLNLFLGAAASSLLPTVGHPVVCQLPGSMKLLCLSPSTASPCKHFNFLISDFLFGAVRAQSAH